MKSAQLRQRERIEDGWDIPATTRDHQLAEFAEGAEGVYLATTCAETTERRIRGLFWQLQGHFFYAATTEHEAKILALDSRFASYADRQAASQVRKVVNERSDKALRQALVEMGVK